MTALERKAEITGLGLSDADYVIIGSGILGALALRESNDLDLLVSDRIFNALTGEPGWTEFVHSDGTIERSRGEISMKTAWGYGDVLWQLPDVLADCVRVDGLNYVSLARLRLWKNYWARPKDVADIKLIDEYVARHV